MRRRTLIFWTIITFSCLLGAGLLQGGPTSAQEETSEIQSQIQSKRAEMERLKQEAERLGTQLQKSRAQGKAASAQLAAIEITLKKTQAELAYLSKRLEVVRAETGVQQREVTRLTTLLEKRQRMLSNRMIGMYKQSRLAQLEILVTGRDLVEMEQTGYYLQLIAARDGEVIQDTLGKKAEREIKIASLKERQEELKETQGEIDKKRREQEQVKSERWKLLAQIKKEIASTESRKKEVERQQKELQSLIAKLSDRLGRVRSTGFAGLKGRLPMPVRGSVFTPDNLPSNLRGRVLLIRAPMGAGVSSVAAGEVVYTGWQRGYGNIVIIGHGDRYMSLYAHLNSISASVGQKVQKGTIIGTVGESASLYGVHLHFEIRQGGSSLDTPSWVR